jgi:hypothetical protein
MMNFDPINIKINRTHLIEIKKVSLIYILITKLISDHVNESAKIMYANFGF